MTTFCYKPFEPRFMSSRGLRLLSRGLVAWAGLQPSTQLRLDLLHSWCLLTWSDVYVILLRQLSQLPRHDQRTDIHEVHTLEIDGTSFVHLLAVVVEVLRDLRPMQPGVHVVHDVVAVVEGRLIHGGVHAIVRQGVITEPVRLIHEDVLRPIAERHGGHGNDVGDDEDPERRDEIDLRGKDVDQAHPAAESSSYTCQMIPLLVADDVMKKVGPNLDASPRDATCKCLRGRRRKAQ